ncbi:MAG: FAD-binding protein, partial [Microcoleus sp.]
MKSFSTENYVSTQELESIVGTAGICRWPDTEPFWHERVEKAVAPDTKIDCTVYPNTQEELAAVIAWAGRNHWGVLPCGSGSKLDWGGLVKEVKIAVSTGHLNRLVEHAVGDLTVTAEAGMKFADLQEILGKAGQFLPIDPAYPQQAT